MPEPISATVCSFNAEKDLGDCLRSLKDQQQFTFDEILVVDNASTDGTVALIERDFPDVRLIRLEQNEGPGPARNAGLREARNRYVFQVDSDVIVAPDCMVRLAAEMQLADDLAVVFPRGLDASDRSVVHYDGGSHHYAGVMALRHFYTPVTECTTEAEDVDAFVSLAALLDRARVLEVGGYDPAYFILFEDADLSYRLRICGYRIRSLPDALVDHRSGTAGISFRGGSTYPARRLFLHSRNRWMLILKCYRVRTLILTLPGVLLLGLAYVMFAWRQGALGDYLRAKRSLIALFPRIREERRKLAGLRKLSDRDLLGAPDLTFSPKIERGRGGSLPERCLSSVLRLYWLLIRPFVG